jgi:mRNA interferase RelE/StbE
MAWRIRLERGAERDLERLPRKHAQQIVRYLHERLAPRDDPRSLGAALQGATLGEFWRYRVGDYRVIASIRDDIVTIVVVRVGNRRDVYRR